MDREKNKEMMACICMVIIVIAVTSLVSASLNVQLSDQGTGVAYLNGTTLSSGDLTVLIYDAPTVGNLVYNETFSSAISNGSWNVMLGGGGTNLPLEFGEIYYKDYLIAGEDASFDGDDRQEFYSGLGDVNGSKLINATLPKYKLETCSNDEILKISSGVWVCASDATGGSVNDSVWNITTSNYLINSSGILIINETKLNETIDARGGGTVNLTNYALKNQSEVFAGNITTTSSGFFGWLGSLVNRITKLWVGEINATGNIVTEGNVSADYFIGDGSLLDGIAILWSENTTTGNTWLTNTSMNVGIGTNNPDDILHLNANNAGLKLEDDSGNYARIKAGNSQLTLEADPDNAVASTDIVFAMDGSEVARFLQGGNFGIGTNNPSHKLSVIGSANVTENITANYFIGDGSQLTGVNIITESTGLITGGAVSINGGDSTLIDISAGSGQIVDSTTDPDNPTLTPITWANITGYNLTTAADPYDVVAIYLSLNSSGGVVERLALPTAEERRDTIDLGIAARYEGTTIVFAGSGPANVIHSPGSQTQDFLEAWGAFNIDGNQIQLYGTGLQIQKTEGSIFRNGVNFQTNPKNPHVNLLIEQSPISPFNYKLSDGTDINLSSIQLDPNYYDDGTDTPAAVDNNKWTVQYVSVFATGTVEVLYGQEIFGTQDEAIVALSSISFTIPADSKNAIPLAYVILAQGDTSLSADRFYSISRGGAVGGGGVIYTAGTGLILASGGTEFSLNTTYTDDRYINSGNDTGNFTLSGNLTLGQKLTFAFGEIIDNIVDGWIRITGNLNVNGTVKIEDDLNMTSNNITAIDCIVFKSGGKICNSP